MRLSRHLLQRFEFLQYVPHHDPVSNSQIERFQSYLDQLNRLVVLTGAGISTESGIPDYRSEKVGRFARTNAVPIQYQDFIRSANVRKRYWARNYVGWPLFSSAQPNVNHLTLSEWEKQGRIKWLITQNIDNLHTKAGSQNITELHGSGSRVKCLQCNHKISRDVMQQFIAELNPYWEGYTCDIAPDGDVDISDELIQHFITPHCPLCGTGTLQPDVVFFGANVPKDTVDFCFEQLDKSDGLLVLGSSLFIWSGLRFAKRAAETDKPLLIINIGPTRADNDYSTIKLSCKCSDVLPKLNV